MGVGTRNGSTALRSAPEAKPLTSWERRTPQAGPRSPRRRSWGLVALAALLVVGTGLAVTAWGLNAGQRESVVAVAGPIPRGHVIERADLVSVSVSGVDSAIRLTDVDRLVGDTATVDLVAGQILTEEMVSSSPLPTAGQSVVGLSLDPSRVPTAGLGAGDVVDVYLVPPLDSPPLDSDAALDEPELLAHLASVYEVEHAADSAGQMLLTLVVAEPDAARLAAYSTQNRLAVVEIAPDPDAAVTDGDQ